MKYEFLSSEALPVIISKELEKEQEEKLIELIKEKKKASAWDISDIKGISPTVCQHRINLINEEASHIEPARRINTNMMKVVKKEIMKLLKAT